MIQNCLSNVCNASQLSTCFNVQFPETNVFGIGNISALVDTVSTGFPRNVRVERNTDNLKNTWTVEDYGNFYTGDEDSDFSKVANELVSASLRFPSIYTLLGFHC